MPRHKETVKKVQARLSEKAWKNLDGKGNISKQINEAIEKIGEQEVQTAINECPRYYGIDHENPDLVVCKDNEGKGKLYFPKIECRACKFHHDNSVIIKSEKRLEEELGKQQKELEKLEKDVSKLKAIKEGHLKEISQLKQEHQAVNVPNLEEKLTAKLALLKEKNEEIATLQTDNEQLREQLREQSQLSKIEPKIEYRDRIVEKPQYIVKTVKETVEKVVYKDRLEGLKILCKMGKGLVSFTDECLQKCQDAVECTYHYSIVREKTIPEDAKLQFP